MLFLPEFNRPSVRSTRVYFNPSSATIPFRMPKNSNNADMKLFSVKPHHDPTEASLLPDFETELQEEEDTPLSAFKQRSFFSKLRQLSSITPTLVLSKPRAVLRLCLFPSAILCFAVVFFVFTGPRIFPSYSVTKDPLLDSSRPSYYFLLYWFRSWIYLTFSGDSYTQTGYDPNGEHPNDRNPLGNPPSPTGLCPASWVFTSLKG